MRKYRSYHTSLKLIANRGQLPKHYSESIDRSTIWRWKQEPDDKYTGIELSDIEILEEFIARREAQNLMKSYLKLAVSIGMIFSSSQGILKNLKTNKERFVKTIIHHQKHIDTTLVLRLLKIPTSVFHYWKNKVLYKCETSPLKLCQRKYPQQLTTNEVSTLKELALSEQFKYWPTCSLAGMQKGKPLKHLTFHLV